MDRVFLEGVNSGGLILFFRLGLRKIGFVILGVLSPFNTFLVFAVRIVWQQ